MPSTSTTTVTIGTILDLIGSANQTSASNDGQSGFDTLLQLTQAAAQPQPISPPASAAPRSSTTVSRPADAGQKANANEVPRSDSIATSSNQEHDSTQSESAPNAKPPAADNTEHKTEHNELEHPNEKPGEQIATEQVIAQSLAGLPAATQGVPVPDAAVSTDAIVTSQEGTIATKKPNATQANKFVAQVKAANPQADGPQDVVAQTNAVTDDQSLGGELKSAIKAAEDESTAQKASVKVQAVEKVELARKGDTDQTSVSDSQQTVDIQLAGDEKPQFEPTQTVRHDQSPTSDTPQSPLDASSLNAPNADAANSNITSSTPLVAPVANVPPPAEQPSGAPTSNSNNAAAVSGASPRARLPAQALVPAGSVANRHNPVEIDAARLISRVVRAFSAAQERDGEVRLRLSPPELGALRLDVRVENGVLTAHLQTETDSARLAILDNLPTLRDRLADQGVRIERFDVDLMQRQPGGMPDQPGGRQAETPEAPLRVDQPAPSAKSQPTSVSTGAAAAVAADSGLNVIV